MHRKAGDGIINSFLLPFTPASLLLKKQPACAKIIEGGYA
jgi:hypothetical protein